jgi:hypothetical protein
MDDITDFSVSLPTPPIPGIRLRAPGAPSFKVRLPPPPPPRPGLGGTVSPQKRGRTNYPLGPFSIKRSKGGGSGGAAAATSVAESGSSDEEVESYSEYLEYIQSGAIGFLKLHGDIYVVQGWDGKRKAAKVWFPGKSTVTTCTHFQDRINGITYTVPAWVKSKQSYVSARHATHLMIAFTQSF